MSKPIYLSLFFLALLLPFVFCQSSDPAGGGPADEPSSPDEPSSLDEPSSPDEPGPTPAKPTGPTKVEQVKPTQPAPKDAKTALTQLTDEHNTIKDQELSNMGKVMKAILTPVIYSVRGLLFSVKLLLIGVLKTVKGTANFTLKSLGLGLVDGLVGPTMDGLIPIINNLIDAVLCLLASLAYGPPLQQCPVRAAEE